MLLALIAIPVIYANAQAAPTASQRFQLSAFGGATGTYTGLNSGKNLGITAGIDLGFRPFFSVHPSFELRGSYPLDKGSIDSQKNILAGLKTAKTFGRFHPYADILFGRGEIDYSRGFPDPSRTFNYVKTTSNVISPGIGLDFACNDHLAFKVDAQLQRWSTPVTVSDRLYSKPITLGIVYRFDFNHHPRLAKQPDR